MNYKAYKLQRSIPWGQGFYEVNTIHAFMIDKIKLIKNEAEYNEKERDFAFAYFLASDLQSTERRKKIFFQDPESCTILNPSVNIYFGVSDFDYDNENEYTQKNEDVNNYDLYKKDLSINNNEFFNFINSKDENGINKVKIIDNPIAMWLPDLISNGLIVRSGENKFTGYGLDSTSLNTQFDNDVASGVITGAKSIIAGALDMNLLGNISLTYIYCWIAGRAFEHSLKPADEITTIIQ